MNEIIKDYNPSELLEALENKDVKKLREIIENYNLVDIAETLDDLDNIEEYVFLFHTIPTEYTAEIFSYLDNDTQEDIVNKLTSEELTNMIDNLNSDDIVDVLQELPANLVNRILKVTPLERRATINQLLNYKEDSAGSIMTTEFIMIRENDNKKECIDKIKAQGKKAESISNLFVVDAKRSLKGTINIRDVIYMEDDDVIKDLMETDFVSVNTNTDQEEVAQAFSKYDLTAIPVISSDNRLVGIITIDDVIDVIEEETTEDIHKTANITPLEDEYMKTNSFVLTKNSIFWLIGLMLLSTLTAIILSFFNDALSAIPALSIFIPMLISTAGNAGNQTSAIIVRALGLNEISPKDYIKVASKELLSALMVGLGVALVNFGWILLLNKLNIIEISTNPNECVKIGLLVGVAMLISILVSKFIGASLPLLCKAIKIDPAVVAGPMVTTLVDATSIIIYFLVAKNLFHLI